MHSSGVPLEKIYNYALWLLSKRSYSKSGLSQKIKYKLRKLEISDEMQGTLLQSTIDKLEEKKLLDDQRHKEIIIARYQNRWGFQKIKQKLASEQIELTKEEWNQNQSLFNTETDVLTGIQTDTLLERKAKKYWSKYSQKFPEDRFKTQTKTIQSLLAQGHEYQEIKKILKNLIHLDS